MPDYGLLIASVAGKFTLDPKVLSAQVQVESGTNTFAWNPEPQYKYLVDVRTGKPFRALSNDEISSETPPSDFPFLAGDRDQEWWGQQASWGLLQIMGAVAREHGFKGPYLVELCDPEQGLLWGCTHLAGLVQWAHGNIRQALAAYNGGKGGNSVAPFRNDAYAAKVLAQIK